MTPEELGRREITWEKEFAERSARWFRFKLKISGNVSIVPVRRSGGSSSTPRLATNSVRTRSRTPTDQTNTTALSASLQNEIGAGFVGAFQMADGNLMEQILSGVASSNQSRTITERLIDIFSGQLSRSFGRGIFSVSATTPNGQALREGFMLTLEGTVNANPVVEWFLEQPGRSGDLDGYAVATHRTTSGRVRRQDVRIDGRVTFSIVLGPTEAALSRLGQTIARTTAAEATETAASMAARASCWTSTALMQIAFEVIWGVAEMPSETSVRANRDLNINFCAVGYLDQVRQATRDANSSTTTILGSTWPGYNVGVRKATTDINRLGSGQAVWERLVQQYGTNDRSTLTMRIYRYLRRGSGSLDGANILDGSFQL